MSNFQPITPAKAIDFVEAAGVSEGRRLIADFAAAGLVKAYALAIETIEVGGAASTVRDKALPPALWHRIVNEGLVDDVWSGGTVRLRPADLRGGEPEVRITGIRFNEKLLQRLVDHHLGAIPKPLPSKAAKPIPVEPPIEAAVEPSPPVLPPVRRGPDAEAIPPGALLVTVDQAQKALGFGRTKINELMIEGRLVRKKIGRAVRIEVASLRALLNESG